MQPASQKLTDAPILILAPLGNDAVNASEVLTKVGIASEICASMHGLCHRGGPQTGAFLITEDVFEAQTLALLINFLITQPAWSDIPIILLTGSGDIKLKTSNILNFLGTRANVTLLEKPLRVQTLVSVVKAALRSRMHQQEVRKLLDDYAGAAEDAHTATAKFKALFDQSAVFAGIMTVDGKIIEANRLFLDACGYRAEDVLGRPFWECGWWRGSQLVQEKIRLALEQVAQGNPYVEILPYYWADGTERVVDLRIYPIRDEKNEVIFLHPTGIDITELQQNQQRTEFVGQLLQKLTAISDPDVISETAARETGEFLKADGCTFFQKLPEPGHVQLLPDWRAEDKPRILGVQNMADFGEPDWWRAVQTRPVIIEDVSRDPWTKKAAEIYHKVNIASYVIVPFVQLDGWVGYISVCTERPRAWTEQDVALLQATAARVWPLILRAKAEAELRESEERFRAMSDNIPQLAWMTSADGWVFWYNQRWYDYTGTTLEHMQGWGWRDVQHPEHLERVVHNWKTALAAGTHWRDTFPLKGADGKYRWFLSSASPVRDLQGKITLWFGTNTDVTELANTQEALREANVQLADKTQHLESLVQQRTAKLQETIGELEAFSYSIAHDLRSPLRSLQGYSDILLSEYSDKIDEEGRRFLNRTANAALRMDKLIQDVLSYSRVVRAELPLEKINMDQLIRGIADTYPTLAPEKVDVVLEGKLPPIMGNEAMVTQIFSNLMGNAVKFVSPGVKPHLKVWAEKQGPKLRFFVRDNGIGIAPDQHKKIFNIFQQVDKNFEGTGIGLAIVRKAAERIGGNVGLESELGQGSTFWVDLTPG